MESMKKFSFKKVLKFVAGAVGAAAVLSFAIFPSLNTQADGPRFNFMNGDYELMRGANTTNHETVWKDPITAKAGDSFEAVVYYHNGMINTTALNTTIKANIPAQTTSKSAKLTASISADNAATVTDTVVDGQIVGMSGLTVNFDQDVTLSMVPGSLKWYPNKQNTVVSPLPSAQSGNEVITPSGVNIGNINGCWDYSGFVVFAVKSHLIAKNSISIEKTVKNITKNQAVYTKSTNADQSDKVGFKLDVKFDGNKSIQNAVVSDQLPSELSIVSGSAKLTMNSITTSISDSILLSNGVNIGEFVPGQIESATITFEATAPAQILAAKTVVNTGKVIAGTLNDSDTASVALKPGSTSIVRSKSAYNQTQNIDATKVVAKAGDIIVYTLTTKNEGTLGSNIIVKDGIVDILDYADIIAISDNGSVVDGPVKTNDEKQIVYPAADIAAHSQIVRTFAVKVKNPIPTTAQNGFHFDHKMYNIYGNEVIITVEIPTIPVVLKPVLSVDKFVRNVTANEMAFIKADTAFAGDTLEYKIIFKNSGNGKASDVKISDLLPADVSIDTSSAVILGLGGAEKAIDGLTKAGFVIKSIAAGEEGYVRFKAVISAAASGGQTLTNTGLLEDNGVTIKSTADTVIKQRIVPVVVKTPETKTLPRTGTGTDAIVYSIVIAMFVSGSIYAFAERRIK